MQNNGGKFILSRSDHKEVECKDIMNRRGETDMSILKSVVI